MYSRNVKYIGRHLFITKYNKILNFRWPLPSKKNGIVKFLRRIFTMAEIELNTKIFKKDNLDIVYSITGKKLLNGILHYKLKSENSEEIYLSEFAINDRFITQSKHCEQPKNSVSRLFTKIINKGYTTGKSNE